MTKTLDVYLRRDLVGHLKQDKQGLMIFSYVESWLEKPNSMPLSHSLPLRAEPFEGKECKGFFGGILPEEEKRVLIAKNLGISTRNDYAMLEQIGGECAGAVTFIPAGRALPDHDYRYRQLSDGALAEILRELPRRPLMAGTEDIRLSLAGAQDKIAVYVSGDNISLPLGGAPSTHILKPAIERFEGVVFNEAVCMKLALAAGLPTAEVEFRQVEGIDYLLVKRYDRQKRMIPGGSISYERLHQEDFCQALGIASEIKYQSEGGPSLKQCFALLRDVSRVPIIDLQRLLDAVIFNVLVGNHDAHGKNFSFTCGEGTITTGRDIRLAPLYDLVSTVYYPELTPKMAMRIGGESRSDKLRARNFEKLADEANLAKPMVIQRVPELARTILETIDEIDIVHPVGRDVIALIKKRCEKFIRLFVTV
ncbi:Toxin HigB / Protein kinase domain of HipA [hydrothermal vent metagenome]|uniref:Toxin HigB / Protein kinase domain of HipA n=1 Tax=hydrothermal vent metagenome TaxID=652676 RepID=A0A3B0SIP9_9ZZZZ